MISITGLSILPEHKLLLSFSDGVEAELDVAPYIRKGTFTEALLEPDFFNKVRIYDNGRGIFWPNEFDLCPDYLRKQAAKGKAD